MSSKSLAFCIHKVQYLGASYVVKLFTKEYGMQSFFIQNFSKSSKLRFLFQPMQLLDIQMEYGEHKNFQKLHDCYLHVPVLSENIYQQSVQLFIAEVIYKTQKLEEKNEFLFQWLLQINDYLHQNYSVRYLPVYFFSKYLDILGLSPFNLRNKALFEEFFTAHDMDLLRDITQASLQEDLSHHIQMTAEDRRELMAHLQRFYASDFVKCSDILSIQVFEEVFEF